MRHPDVRTDLAAASSSYRDAFSQFKTHQECLQETLETILPKSQKARFQKYLDYKNSPSIAFAGEDLGLPLTPPTALMGWGAETEEKLSNTHDRTNHLRERVFITLSDALYALGYTAPEWVAPRADGGAGGGTDKPYLQTIYRIASDYRKEHLDGKDILTPDGPFVNGLAKRLNIKPERIFQSETRLSAFEMAYWAIQDRQHMTHEEPSLRC